MSKSLQALRHVPCLQSLYDLLQQVEVEYPTKILVADSPFFVDQYGEIYEGAVVNPSFIPKHRFSRGSALVYELEVIARGILDGAYRDTELELLQTWAKVQMGVIRKGLRVSDRHSVRQLKRLNLLN